MSMKKPTHKKKSASTSAWNSLMIVVLLIVAIGIGTLLITKAKERAMVQESVQSSLEPSVLTLSPKEGCTLSESGDRHVCNIGVRNASSSEMSWVGYIGGISGATLSNDGYGVIAPDQSAFVELSVPVAYCETNPQGIGEVTIIDKERSTNQGIISFHCSN